MPAGEGKRLTVPAGMPDAAHSAWRVALRRAAHQLFDEPAVFRDPYAVPLLGAAGREALARTPKSQGRVWSKSLRAFVVARSCFAEEQLAAAYARGVRQYCMLGAGLDTFALRNSWSDLRVVEVDQAAVQAWKEQVLAREAGLTFASRCEQVAGDLAGMAWPPGSLRAEQRTFFSMLGVAPFLPHAAFRTVLGRIAQSARGSAVVFDYRVPSAALDAEEQRQQASLQRRATAKGEPFDEGWTPEQMQHALDAFARTEDLSREELNARYFGGRDDGLAVRGAAARIVLAVI